MLEPLITDRLIVRPVRPDDVDALMERRNDREVAEFQDWPLPCTRDYAEKIIAEDSEAPTPNSWWMATIADRADAVVLGDISMRIGADGIATIGYSLGRDHWGVGYATEALHAVMRWLFDEREVVRIDASIHPQNYRSAKMLENCGFEFVGVDRNALWDRHGRVDDERYCSTPELYAEWMGRPRHAPESVALVELDPNDVRSVTDLVTHRSQRRFATPIAISLAEAAVPPYAFNSEGTQGSPQVVPWYRIIHADGEPVGFVMIDTPTETDPEPYLWRLLVDRMHQRRGIGRRVVEMVIEQARAWESASISVSWGPGVGSPEPLYLAMGFVPTGEIEEGEVVARLVLD